MRVQILASRSWSRNEYSFLFPLRRFTAELSARGIRLQIGDFRTVLSTGGDALIVNSHAIRELEWWDQGTERLHDFLHGASKRYPLLIWADVGDSTGCTHFNLLEHVSLYLKGSLLRDLDAYSRKYYGARVFTDYYHREFGVSDHHPGEEHLREPLDPAHRHKLAVSWNQAFANYSFAGTIYDQAARRLRTLPPLRIGRPRPPRTPRPRFLHCRFGVDHRRATVRFQRERLLALLGDRVDGSRVSRWSFFKELGRSRVVLSPFGWGEICYRDFEALWAGAALLKPDCDHLETWPDFYRPHDTYLPIPWSLETIDETLDFARENADYMESLAQGAQRVYRENVYASAAPGRFVDRFSSLLDRASRT